VLKSTILFAVILMTLPNLSLAAGSGDFEYPELLVAPKASERIDLEAKQESDRRLGLHAAIQISAITTLVAGIMQQASFAPVVAPAPQPLSGYAGISVGALWIATTAALEFAYQPYVSAKTELAAMPSKTQRDQLVRERLAEEDIHGAASLAQKLRWLSFLSNVGAGGYMVAMAPSGSAAQVADGIAMAAAFAPLIWGSHWIDVDSEQRDYKKKIYAPIATGVLVPQPSTGQVAPALALIFRI